MALFRMLTSKHLLPGTSREREGREKKEGEKKNVLFDDKFTTRCSLLVDHVIEESKRRRRVKRTLSGRKYRGKIRSMNSAPLSCPQTYTWNTD